MNNTPSANECPCCAADTIESIYKIESIPAQSCLLMDSAQQARDYPTGNLEWVFCDTCGFLFNAAWNDGLLAYDATYEETQHFSETFHQFAVELAQTWLDRYELQGKQVVEIGCGKAEFLTLMCELGGNRGIGIDPTVDPERLPERFKQLVTLIPEYFSREHLKFIDEVVCCRHTLEHIGRPGKLLDELRLALDDKPNALLLFELPDTRRILDETAFWDIYYEHCSYFTAGSLARLFRRFGFEPVDLERVYRDQYIVLAAQKAIAKTTGGKIHLLEKDLSETRDMVGQFKSKVRQGMDIWRSEIERRYKQGQRVVLWGAGSKAVSFCTSLGLQQEVDYAIDINPFKQGKFLPGSAHRVLGPEHVKIDRPDCVVVMNPIYEREIVNQLHKMGVTPEILLLQ